jgi:SAM-dependent methyltransferase
MSLRERLIARLRPAAAQEPRSVFPLVPPLPLPPGVSEPQLAGFLESVLVAGAPSEEMKNYCRSDFRRFVYTYGLLRDLRGRCLELGSNPYFTTMLLRQFTAFELTLANFFTEGGPSQSEQDVYYRDLVTREMQIVKLASHHFNIERGTFPFPDATFDALLFGEIIEHLLMDPAAALREIKRVLKPRGTLVLTTPNVARLENVARMIAGANIYDPYSGYGPYGRHNREYNRHELVQLLSFLGFEVADIFTADVHPNHAAAHCPLDRLEPLVRFRQGDLGQYIFVKAVNARPAGAGKPSMLYRSYPASELV